MRLFPESVSRTLRRGLANRWLIGLLIALLVSAIAFYPARQLTLIELSENYLGDLRVALMSPPRPQSQRIAIIIIDDKTLAGYPYRSPLDRSLIAGLIAELEARGVRAIGINVLFDRPTEVAKDELLYRRLHDSTVPVVLSRVSSLLGYSASQVEFSRDFIGDLRSGLSFIYRDTVDDTIRSSMLKRVQGRNVNLGFAATLAATLGVALPDVEKLVIDFRPGPDASTPPFPLYRAHEVVDLPAAALADRVVLIGADLGDDSGLRTPLAVLDGGYARNLSGVEIEAHVLSQLIEGRSLETVSARVHYLLTLAMAGLGCLLSMVLLRLWVKILLLVIFIPLFWLTAFLIFAGQGLLLPIIVPSLAFVGAMIVSAFWQWRAEYLRRERIHHAFGRFLAPEIVDKIMHDADALEMRGEKRELSFLFTDLEGFTRLTESTLPQKMVELVNAYLEEACEIVIEHGGIVDKIVGDALHTMFNAPLLQPDHAQRAVACALALDRWSGDFRQRMADKGIELGVTRIGVNTGECIVGNFGGARRFDYTAHGDVVNATARLEAVNKRLGTRICVGAATVALCEGIHFRPVAELVLPGKQRGIAAWLPVAEADHDPELQQRYRQAYDLLAAGDPAAVESFAELAAHYPEDALIGLHHARLCRREFGTTLVIRSK